MPDTEIMFRLVSTYEYFVDIQGSRRLVRIEIFKSIDDALFRTRVWLQNIYNLYPALINTDKAGNNLNLTHSADEVNIDISSLVVDNEEYIFGKPCLDERELIDYLVKMINRHFDNP